MKAPHVFFSENLPKDGEPRTWSYGHHKALTAAEVETIKKLLPSPSIIIQCDFQEPSEYVYPSQNENQ